MIGWGGGWSGLHYSDSTAGSGTWWSGFRSHLATSQLWDLGQVFTSLCLSFLIF